MILTKWATLGVVLVVAWNWIDASLSLFFYDLFVPSNFQSLQNKTIWLTGASSGIGAALACHLIAAEAQHGELGEQFQCEM